MNRITRHLRVLILIIVFSSVAYADQKEFYVSVVNNSPENNVETEVFLGDRMLTQGIGQWVKCITPRETLSKKVGWEKITVRANEPLCAETPGQDFESRYDNFESRGETKQFDVIWEEHKTGWRLCVANKHYCFKELDTDFVTESAIFMQAENSLQRTIEYSGKSSGVVNFTYSEFAGGLARDAFTRQFTFDPNEGNVAGYKGAIFEVIEATNMKIRYKVIRNFDE